jgi:hypothetical protein
MDIKQALQKVKDTEENTKGTIGEAAGMLVGLPVATLAGWYKLAIGKSWSEASSTFSTAIDKSGSYGRRYGYDVLFETLKTAGAKMAAENQRKRSEEG